MSPGRSFLPAALPFAACVAVLLFVWRYGVELPYWDEWYILPPLVRILDGQASLAELWPVHNEHRILVPRLLLLASAVLCDLRLRLVMAFGVVLAFATWLLLRRRLPGRPWALALTALLLFSLHAWGNWLWAIQLVVFACVAAAIAALSLLAAGAPSVLRFAAALGLGAAASTSFTCGFLVWPIGALLLWLRRTVEPERRRPLAVFAALWLTAGVALLGLHLATLPAVGAAFGGSTAGAALVPLLLRATAFLGSAVTGRWLEGALVTGALAHLALVVLPLSVFVRPRLRTPARLFAAAVGLFALGSAWMAALGRVSHGLEQALTSRYATFAALGWVTVLVTAADLAAAHRRWRVPVAALFAGVTATLLWTQPASFAEARAHHAVVLRAQRAILTGSGLDLGVMHGVFPHFDEDAEWLDALRRDGLSLYAGLPADAPARRTVAMAAPEERRLDVQFAADARAARLVVTLRAPAPGNLVALRLLDAAGRVFERPLHLGVLDASGEARVDLPLPQAPIVVQAECIDRFGSLVRTPLHTWPPPPEAGGERR